MRIILTRHGETEENRKRILMGHVQGVLSDLGKEQARKLAERLKNEKIDLIISSDLARAHETAKAIAKYHQVPLKTSVDLRERDLGILVGKEVRDSKGNFLIPLEDFEKHGEAQSNMLFRAKRVIDELIKANVENVLIVAHAGINKAIISVFNGKGHEGMKDVEHLENTSVSEYTFDGEKWNVNKFNCVEHLK